MEGDCHSLATRIYFDRRSPEGNSDSQRTSGKGSNDYINREYRERRKHEKQQKRIA